MHTTEKKESADSLCITVMGKRVRLFFMPEANYEAAGFIKKTLMNAYTLKAV